jgi:uncharacterized phage-like protein YoqJ
MIVAFTGHRPDKLPNKETGYILPNPTYIRVCKQIESKLIELKPEKVISGMALGIDQWAAYIAYKLKILFLAAIPFINQESMWPEQSQKTYNALLKIASEQVIVSEGAYSPQKMQIRNAWMVDHCDKLIAVYNGDNTGGTANCVNYAKQIGKDIIIINPSIV